MIGLIFLIIILFIITQGIYARIGKKHSFLSKKLLNILFAYHLFFFIVYFVYALLNPSDSKAYYARGLIDKDWLTLFGTSTTFIDFIAFPFINTFQFEYSTIMFLFSWLGFLGFFYAYLFFRENIPLNVKVFKKLDFLTLILFLPNMHFWTASLGKGAPIFLGLMMFAYAIKYPKDRLFTLLIGSALIYFIRPHVFLFVAVGTVLGYMSGKEKISFGRKLFIYVAMIGGLLLVQDQILGVVGLENSDDLVADFGTFSDDRTESLGDASSGVDMASYPLPLKLFTFWFRPLFFDAPGILGLITSIENLIYLLLFFKIIRRDFVKFIKNSPIAVKMSLVVFLLSSFAMTFVMSNLGIIMRQKSMVMYFLFFVIYYYLAQKKYDKLIRLRKIRNSIKLKQEQKIITNNSM